MLWVDSDEPVTNGAIITIQSRKINDIPVKYTPIARDTLPCDFEGRFDFELERAEAVDNFSIHASTFDSQRSQYVLINSYCESFGCNSMPFNNEYDGIIMTLYPE